MGAVTEAAGEPGRQGAGLRRLLDVGPAYGLFLVTGSAMLAEATGHAGLSWAVVDMEGAAMTRVDALHQVQALTAAGVAPVIRVPGLERNAVEFALDLGAAGVVVPKVDTPEEAALAAALTRYPPQGRRGVNSVRAGSYYTQSKEYFASANREILCIVQIESQEAVANAAAIARTPGVDMLFIGANDLAMALGTPGDVTTPDFAAARQAVLTACAQAGKRAGAFALSTRLAREYANEGFRFVAIGNEVKLFMQSAALAVGMLRKQEVGQPGTRPSRGRVAAAANG
jgi:2-keto-3-deoxy-L-rhamnonate aldolase RhmA